MDVILLASWHMELVSLDHRREYGKKIAMLFIEAVAFSATVYVDGVTGL